VCAFFELWSFENYASKFRPHLRHKISCSSPSPSTHLLLSSSSYSWLPIVVSLFLTHLLLEVVSSIIFLPSPFRCHWCSRNKGLHWWRRSKTYKLHMKLHPPPPFLLIIFIIRASNSNCSGLWLIVWGLNNGFWFKSFLAATTTKQLEPWFWGIHWEDCTPFYPSKVIKFKFKWYICYGNDHAIKFMQSNRGLLSRTFLLSW